MLGHFVVTFSKLQNIGTALLVVVCLANEIFIGMFSRSLRTRIKQKNGSLLSRGISKKAKTMKKWEQTFLLADGVFILKFYFMAKLGSIKLSAKTHFIATQGCLAVRQWLLWLSVEPSIWRTLVWIPLFLSSKKSLKNFALLLLGEGFPNLKSEPRKNRLLDCKRELIYWIGFRSFRNFLLSLRWHPCL